jgi:hypothetical protein
LLLLVLLTLLRQLLLPILRSQSHPAVLHFPERQLLPASQLHQLLLLILRPRLLLPNLLGRWHRLRQFLLLIQRDLSPP